MPRNNIHDMPQLATRAEPQPHGPFSESGERLLDGYIARQSKAD